MTIMGEDETLEGEWVKLSKLLIGNWTTQTIATAVKLGLIEALAKRPMEINEIARYMKLEEDGCKRLIRALITLKIVGHSKNVISLTRMGSLLREEHKWSLANAAILWSEEHYDSWKGLTESVTSGKAYFQEKYGNLFFEWIQKKPGKWQVYQDALKSYAEHDYRYIPRLYDFSHYRTIVDVGGGSGTLLKIILKHYPELRGILFDRPEILSVAKQNLSSSSLKGRFEIITGNFFEEIPCKGDMIILARVLHDWEDSKVEIILNNCYNALSNQGVLMIIELLMSQDLNSNLGTLLNLNLLVMTGGKERTLDEYERLLMKANFKFSKTIETPSVVSIILAEKG